MVFGVDIQKTLTKADRLIYGESAMTHAMVFTAVSLDVSLKQKLQLFFFRIINNFFVFSNSLKENNQPKKLRVENSWGEDRGEKGYLVMSADWFKEFGFEVVVDKKYVPEDILRVFDQEPIVLPAWDPMGTLAQ